MKGVSTEELRATESPIERMIVAILLGIILDFFAVALIAISGQWVHSIANIGQHAIVGTLFAIPNFFSPEKKRRAMRFVIFGIGFCGLYGLFLLASGRTVDDVLIDCWPIWVNTLLDLSGGYFLFLPLLKRIQERMKYDA